MWIISLAMLGASIVCGGLLIGLNFKRWEVFAVPTPFLEASGVDLLVHLTFLAVFVASLVYILLAWRWGRRWKAFAPLAINLLTIAGVMYLPVGQIIVSVDYHANRAERERVVSDVLAGVLQPKYTYTSSLSLIGVPSGYGQVSKGSNNEIVMEREGDQTNIRFFTYRNLGGISAGFVYRSDGSPPTEQPFGNYLLNLKQFDTHWYWFTEACLTCEVADLVIP